MALATGVITNAEQVWDGGGPSETGGAGSGGNGGVWHFGTPLSNDSTGNNVTTNFGVAPGPGIVGSGGVFDGAGDTYMSVPYNPNYNLSGGNFDIEGWFKSSSFANRQVLLSNDTWGVDYDWCIFAPDANDLAIYTAGTAENYTVGVPTMNANQWYSVAIVGTAGIDTIYLDGQACGSSTYMPLTNASQTNLTIGLAGWNNPNTPFDGDLDEVRLSQSSRSPAWIGFEYANINNAGNDLTFGAPEAAPTASLATTVASSFNYGDPQSFTATLSVTSSFGGLPSGDVDFYDGSNYLGSASIDPSTATTTSATATLSGITLPLGDHAITAYYEGDDAFPAATSPVQFITVTPQGIAPPTLSLSDEGPVDEGSTYTLHISFSNNSLPVKQWVINWGDGSTNDTITNPSASEAETHVYQAAGNYVVQATATESDDSGNNYSFTTTLDHNTAVVADTGFGTIGTGEGGATDLGAGAIVAAALQPDGSIVAIQSAAGVNTLVRTDSSGNADGTTFDDVDQTIGTAFTPTMLAIQSSTTSLGDFNIIAADSAGDVVRYNSDGSLDTTFGTGGVAAISGTTSILTSATFSKLLVQADGSIVLVGTQLDSDGTESDLVLARLSANGQLDTTFDGGIENLPLGAIASSLDAAIQPGNQVVSAVDFTATNTTELFRFTTYGTPDSSFGTAAGLAPITGTNPHLAMEADGSFVLAVNTSYSDLSVARHLADGSGIDPTFNDGEAENGPLGQLASVALLPTGKIVLAAETAVTALTNDWVLAELYANGAGDSNFNSGSNVLDVPFTGTVGELLTQPDGKTILAGQSIQASSADAYFARYSSGRMFAQIDAVAPTALTATISQTSYNEGDGTAVIDGSFDQTGDQETDTLTINWGDGTLASPDLETQTLSPGQTTFELPEHDYAVSGNYTITLTVSNAAGNTTYTLPTAIHYMNVGPSDLSLSVDNSTILLGDEINLSGTFTDPGTSDSPTVAIIWNYGESGTPDTTSLTLDQGATTFIADPYIYTTTGTHTIRVTVTDGDVSTTSTTTVDVDSDSSGGSFLTSDGTLHVFSPSTGGNSLTVSQDATTGDVTVSLDGNSTTYQNAGSVSIALQGGGNTVTVASGVTLSVSITGSAGGDSITENGSGDATITGGSAANTITGGFGTNTIYAGDGGDTIIGRGNNEIYGGSGDDTIDVSAGQNNFVQAGSGGDTITGGAGNDWLYGGAGTNYIHGGSGTEKIYGGSGTNYLYGGSGLDNITGGSGTNFIYGNGINDMLQSGGGSKNYILPKTPDENISSIEVLDDHEQYTFDGNVDAAGNPYDGDDRAVDPADPGGEEESGYATDPGYGGVWGFGDLGSGDRLGGAGETPVAVYVTWDPGNTSLGDGTQWAADAIYKVYDGGTLLGSKEVDQATACSANDSPEQSDRHWLRLGVWNVGNSDNLFITLTDNNHQVGDRICIGDAMIYALWPTVSIRPTDLPVNSRVASGNAGDYADWVDARTPVFVPIEGEGDRVNFQLHAAIDSLYAQIPGASMNDWQAELEISPEDSGLELWTASTGGDPLSDAEFSSMISAGNYDGNVWVSSSTGRDPVLSLIFVNAVIGAQAAANATVTTGGITMNVITAGTVQQLDLNDFNMTDTLPGGPIGPAISNSMWWAQAQYPADLKFHLGASATQVTPNGNRQINLSNNQNHPLGDYFSEYGIYVYNNSQPNVPQPNGKFEITDQFAVTFSYPQGLVNLGNNKVSIDEQIITQQGDFPASNTPAYNQLLQQLGALAPTPTKVQNSVPVAIPAPNAAVTNDPKYGPIVNGKIEFVVSDMPNLNGDVGTAYFKLIRQTYTIFGPAGRTIATFHVVWVLSMNAQSQPQFQILNAD